jgi:hypothetical protein
VCFVHRTPYPLCIHTIHTGRNFYHDFLRQKSAFFSKFARVPRGPATHTHHEASSGSVNVHVPIRSHQQFGVKGAQRPRPDMVHW